MNHDLPPPRFSSARLLAASFALFVAVFAATHVASFPGTVAHFKEVTGGQRILDLQPSSSADETWQRLDAMGPAGRAAYTQLVGVVDVVFPLSAFAFLAVLARFASRRAALSRAAAHALVALPLAYLALDAAENLAVLRLLDAFPARLDVEGALVGWLTRGKRIAQLLALLAPLALLAVDAALRLRRRTSGRAAA